MLAAVGQVPQALFGQLTTGSVAGTVYSVNGLPVADSPIFVAGAVGFRTVIHSSSNGDFSLTLPYGQYRLFGNVQDASSPSICVAPVQTVRFDLVVESSGALRIAHVAAEDFGVWTDGTRGHLYPEAFPLPAVLLSREPATVTQPLDFAGLSDNRLPVTSQRGISWTETQYKLNGMDVTDSYQPGLPAVLPDVQALNEVVVRTAFAQITSSSTGAEVGFFRQRMNTRRSALLDESVGDRQPWISATDRSVSLAHQDGLEMGGPITKWADFYASVRGQWASQTEPLAADGTDQRSRSLFGNVRGRIRVTDKDQFDVLYSGSRVDLSDGGVPAGLEAFMANRLAPSFALPGGFPGQPDADHFDCWQLGWIHRQAATSGLNLIELRYGYSVAHLDTGTIPTGQSRIELLGGAVSGAAPLANTAVRPRQEIEAFWQPGELRAISRHQFVAGGGWKTSAPSNRFTTPSDMNLITATIVELRFVADPIHKILTGRHLPPHDDDVAD